MMNGDGPGQGRSKEPVERVIDLFVHTPIGLAVMAWKRVPELVESMPEVVGQALAKGCAQLAEAETRLSEEVRKARMIGQVALTFGGRQVRREVDARLADVRRTAEGVASFISGPTAGDGRSNGAAARPTSPVTGTVTEPEPASPASKAPVRKAPAAKAPATKAPASKGPVRKAPAAKAPGTKAPASKAPARKAATPGARTTKRATNPTGTAPAPGPAGSVEGLPIREYDGLSASQVVSRLSGLTPAELGAVRAYEEASRGRRTILLAIDRLLG